MNLTKLKTYDEVREFLFGLRNTGMKYGIERMERLARALGHPERNYPIIHIAGTNGKGSTCASIEAIYREAGFRTGLYTSPHLIRLNERVQVGRVPIEDAKVVNLTRELIEVGNALEAEEPGLFPSFFEFMTAMAFIHFRDMQVDVAIIEVGLGGRLDATNVVNPDVTAITSIALDHTQILGETLEEIAREKAGILKKNIPVVLGRIEPGPQGVIKEIATERNCSIYQAGEVEDSELPESSLSGRYQRINAAIAAKCVQLLKGSLPVSQERLTAGLKKISWAGRWERKKLESGTDIILDSTHNSEGTIGLAENLESLRDEFGGDAKFLFIAGALGQDRADSLLQVIQKFASELIWICPDQPRASPWDAVKDRWPGHIPAREMKIADLIPSKNTVAVRPSEYPIIVTGSIYLIGEISTYLAGISDGGDAALQDDLKKVPSNQ